MTTIREIERPAWAASRRRLAPRQPDTMGERLTRRRLELGLTQQEVGEMAGVTSGCVRDLEANRSYGGAAYTLAGLSRALKCSMDWLWNGDES